MSEFLGKGSRFILFLILSISFLFVYGCGYVKFVYYKSISKNTVIQNLEIEPILAPLSDVLKGNRFLLYSYTESSPYELSIEFYDYNRTIEAIQIIDINIKTTDDKIISSLTPISSENSIGVSWHELNNFYNWDYSYLMIHFKEKIEIPENVKKIVVRMKYKIKIKPKQYYRDNEKRVVTIKELEQNIELKKKVILYPYPGIFWFS